MKICGCRRSCSYKAVLPLLKAPTTKKSGRGIEIEDSAGLCVAGAFAPDPTGIPGPSMPTGYAAHFEHGPGRRARPTRRPLWRLGGLAMLPRSYSLLRTEG